MNKVFKLLFLLIIITSCSNTVSSTISSNNSSTTNSVISSSSIAVESEKSNLIDPEFCKIRSAREGEVITTGFPIPNYRIPSKGEVNVQAFFIDFPDYKGTRTTSQLNSFFTTYSQGIDSFFTTQSYNKLKFKWNLHPGFITLDENFYDFDLTRLNLSGSNDLDYILRSAIDISDELIDYNGIDFIIVFLNPDIPEKLADVSPAWPLDENWAIVTNEGKIYNATFIAGDAVTIGYSIMAHEIGHLFGLDDLYNFRWYENNPTNDYMRLYMFTGYYDLMSYAFGTKGENYELLGWSKFLLDWITEDQVRCLDASKASLTTHQLVSNHLVSSYEKLVVVRLSNTKALVFEVKSLNSYCALCKGGVYTYIVDSSIASGAGPIRMLKPEHSKEEYFEDSYLSKDQSLVYERIKITNKGIQNNKVVVEVEITG